MSPPSHNSTILLTPKSKREREFDSTLNGVSKISVFDETPSSNDLENPENRKNLKSVNVTNFKKNEQLKKKINQDIQVVHSSRKSKESKETRQNKIKKIDQYVNQSKNSVKKEGAHKTKNKDSQDNTLMNIKIGHERKKSKTNNTEAHVEIWKDNKQKHNRRTEIETPLFTDIADEFEYVYDPAAY